jgi:flagellar basal-body rod protein FlgB
MSAIGLPIMEQLKSRMQWLQARGKLLAENVANADTPKFKPRDLRPADAGGLGMGVSVSTTHAAHLSIGGLSGSAPGETKAKKFETTPSGNSVVLEDEMMKVAETQMDYQAAATLYSKSLGLLKIAIGKRA